jgi:hypothetical protein
VDYADSLFVRRVNQTKDTAVSNVKPVSQEPQVIFILNFEVFLVCGLDCIIRCAQYDVAIHENRH